MKIELYQISAFPQLRDDIKSPCCREELIEWKHGIINTFWFCSKCFSFYELQLNKVPEKKINQTTKELIISNFKRNKK